MKLVKERSITVVFDAVSISKDIEILGGPLTQNFYSESGTYIPNRFITPTVLTPKVYIVDPNNIIPSGDKHEELLECIWYEDGKKIITNDEYKLNKDNTLTVLKNSEKDFTISYSAKWLDPRKKQTITIEDSVQFVTIALGDGNIKPRLTLDKAQNWIHNPLKSERVYSIKAYISKDKLYEGAVEWYCTLKGTEKKLIDNSFLFYEGGQYSNELKVNSAYMPDCIITAKNISDNKLKEIYWFFDKQGNPLTYATPDKTIIEGNNVFSLPESPITSKLDYRIEGLTLTNLIKNGDFRNGSKEWWPFNSQIRINEDGLEVVQADKAWFSAGNNTIVKSSQNELIFIMFKIKSGSENIKRVRVMTISDQNITGNVELKTNVVTTISGIAGTNILPFLNCRIEFEATDISSKNIATILSAFAINLTQAFGAGNEPSKEWCDEHITGYFEGTKSVTAPLRIKSEVGGRNYLKDSRKVDSTGYAKRSFSDSIPAGTYTISFSSILSSKVGLPDTFECLMWFDKGKDSEESIYVTLGKNKRYATIETKLEHSYLFFYSAKYFDDSTKRGVVYDRVKFELGNKSTDWTPAPEGNAPATGSTLYINNNLELKSVGAVKDYIEDGKLYKYISDDGEILKQPEIVNLSTQGSLTTYPNGTIIIEPATLVEKQYNDGLKVDLPVKSLTSIKVGTEYLDVSKAVVKENLITHPELENGDFVTVEYIYDNSPIYGINSIGYLSLEGILDDLWLDNVYTYKVTDGEWELVKITDIEDYEKWLKTEKTSPYTLAPDGIIFGKYEADTKFLRQFPSSLYVDFIAPDRLKEGVTQIKARALVGTKDGVIDKPSRYFKITWLKRALRPGQQDIVIGTGDEILVDVGEKDAITIEIEDLGILKSLVNEQGEYLIEENNKILVGR